VFLGLEDGRFVAAPSLLTDSFPTAVSVADVNRDGAPDVVAAVSSEALLVLLHRK
jgi:hypothetical protein